MDALVGARRGPTCWRRSRPARRRCRCSTRGSGALAPSDYERSVLPHMRRVFDGLADLRRAHDPLRRGDRRAAAVDARRGRRRDRRGLARPARPARGSGSAPTSRVQGNLDPAVCVGPVGRGRTRRDRRCSTARRAATATCSTSVTACCRPRPARTSERLVDLVHERTERSTRERLADRRAGDGVRDRERPRRHRALLHRHPRRPARRRPSTSRSCASATRRSATVPAAGHHARAGRGARRAAERAAGTGAFRAYLGMKHSPPFIPRRSSGCAPTGSSARSAS